MKNERAEIEKKTTRGDQKIDIEDEVTAAETQEVMSSTCTRIDLSFIIFFLFLLAASSE